MVAMHILDLHLFTSALVGQRDFYAHLLDRSPLISTAEWVSFQVGSSRLTFEQAPAVLPGSYHFAFNIPENQFEAAKTWTRRYVTLLTDETGADAFYSENWDAHYLYFYDPAGNIVELIARHTLSNASDAPFSGQSLLNISEIGIAAGDVAAQVAHIQACTGAAPYRWSGNPAFTPVGDEHGLFIVVQQGRIWFPDTGLPAVHLPITVAVENENRSCTLSFP